MLWSSGLSFVLVGAGGFVGTILRYTFYQILGPSIIATLSVNLLGAFLIGVVYSQSEKLPQPHFAILTAGALGGFTTFSAFTADTINLLKAGRLGLAVGYVLAMTLLGLLCTYFGFLVTRS